MSVLSKLNTVNWTYQFDKITDRWLFIIGAIVVTYLPWMSEWPILGGFIQDAQEIDALPNNEFLTIILIKCLIYGIYAASWDLLSGYSGQVSFGHALYLGFGAYISAFYLNGLIIEDQVIFSGVNAKIITISGIKIDINVIYAILIGAIISLLFAIVIGTIFLRLRGPYFALVTLVTPLIMLLLVQNVWEDFTLGNLGIPVSAKLVQDTDKFLLTKQNFYVVTLVFFALSILIITLLARSRFGIVLQSIREDEIAASASGINVPLYKVSVYGISAFFAGLAGGLLSQSLRSSSPSLFGTARSFEVIIYTVLGGIGSITGAVVGSFLLIISVNIYLDDAFIEIPSLETLALGIILFLALRFQPGGIIRSDKRFRNGFFIGFIFAFFVSFYDAGMVFSGLLKSFSPKKLLIDNFGDNGLFGYIDVIHPNGRFLIYFLIGVVLGYFGPGVFRTLRLRFWGVWPSIGNYEPPK